MAIVPSYLISVMLCLGVSFVVPVMSGSVTSSSEIDRNFTCQENTTIKIRSCPNKNKTLYIQGFVPALNDVFTSETIIPAAYMAIDDVNSNCSFLANYSLQLDFVNTQCDPSEATWQLIDSIVLQNRNQTKIAFFGGGCSLATEPIAALSGRFYKIPQISYGASSPSLSQRNLFPRFVRTIPSEIQSNMARFALMKRYKWTKVATLHETKTIFSLAVEDFHLRYSAIFSNNTMSDEEKDENLILRSFTDDPQIPLQQIKAKDIRIIFGYFYEDKAVKTLCRAYKEGLTTKNHLWMFPAWFPPDFWDMNYKDKNSDLNCTRAEMYEAVRNSFFLDSYLFGLNKSERTDTGTESADEFNKKYSQCYLPEFQNNSISGNLTSSASGPHIYRTFAYDAIWTIAHALDKTDQELQEDPNFNQSLDDFAYFDENNISRRISENLQATSFTGISGNVRFNENGTRVGLNAIYQLVNDTPDSFRFELLAIHDPSNGSNFSTKGADFNMEFRYMVNPIFKSGNPPRDRRTPVNQYMSRPLVIICVVVTCIGVIVAIALLIFNLVTICKPLIRDSAPLINTVIVVGCMVMLVACGFLSVDTNNPPTDNMTATIDDEVSPEMRATRAARYKAMCILRLWFLTIGFTLSFGALFAKTWQVYRVYTNPKLQKEPFKMWNFLIIMGIFLFIDVAYLTFWTATYPFRRSFENQTHDESDELRIHEKCDCPNFPYLIGALYVYKGLQVVFGLFLAYESRNVKYYYINDSRFVSIAMYIVVILVGIGAPLSLVLAAHYFTDAAYSLAVFMIIGSTMSCLLILFIPKFVFMAQGKDTMVRENSREEITVSDGLQLGRTTVDQTEIRSVEDEVESQHKEQNAEKDLELQQLEGVVNEEDLEMNVKPPRNGSDGDSGVLVTVDDNEAFSSESTTNGDSHRPAVLTPCSAEEVQTETTIIEEP